MNEKPKILQESVYSTEKILYLGWGYIFLRLKTLSYYY